MGKEWDKIKSSLKGYKTPTGKKKINDTELENLKRIFKAHNIKKISFKNGELVITHNNNNNNNNKTITKDQLTNNSEYQLIKDSLSRFGKNELTSQELGINFNASTNTNNFPNQIIVVIYD